MEVHLLKRVALGIDEELGFGLEVETPIPPSVGMTIFTHTEDDHIVPYTVTGVVAWYDSSNVIVSVTQDNLVEDVLNSIKVSLGESALSFVDQPGLAKAVVAYWASLGWQPVIRRPYDRTLARKYCPDIPVLEAPILPSVRPVAK